MQIVIDINEEDYNDLTLTGENTIPLSALLRLREALRNGTPLPKGHGRLIDADELRRTMEKDVRRALSFVDLTDFVWLADTIIEADKAESEGKNADNN